MAQVVFKLQVIRNQVLIAGRVSAVGIDWYFELCFYLPLILRPNKRTVRLLLATLIHRHGMLDMRSSNTVDILEMCTGTKDHEKMITSFHKSLILRHVDTLETRHVVTDRHRYIAPRMETVMMKESREK